jgi:hypothetical protein
MELQLQRNFNSRRKGEKKNDSEKMEIRIKGREIAVGSGACPSPCAGAVRAGFAVNVTFKNLKRLRHRLRVLHKHGPKS